MITDTLYDCKTFIDNQMETSMPKNEKNENIIKKLGSTSLTEDYVFQSGKSWGTEYYMSIYLKDISFIEFGYKSYPILLILAGLLFVVFLSDANASLLLTALLLVIGFFVTRKHSVIISAHSRQSIVQPLKGKTTEAKDFVHKLMDAKKNLAK